MNDQEIFTLQEQTENTNRKSELIKLVTSGEAVLIVGAGSSARVGYVTWSGLLKRLEDLAYECDNSFKRDEKKRKEDPLEYAKEIKSHICKKTGNLDRYYAFLSQLFKQKDSPDQQYDSFHKTLVSLPFRGIMTTNYDPVLEAALGEIRPDHAYDNSLIIDIDRQSAERVHEFLRAMTDNKIIRRIAHLHGKFYPADSIILDIEDYRKAYDVRLLQENEGIQHEITWSLHRKLLWTVLATRSVIFVGFSMTDRYLDEMLKTVCADLWLWNKSVHFAIMSVSPDNTDISKANAAKLKREYGIDTVFYEDFDKSHRGLDHIIAEIAAQCNIETQSSIVLQEYSDDSEPLEEKKPKPVASGSQDISDWLEQTNRNMEERISRDGN